MGLSTDRFRPDGGHGGSGYSHTTAGVFVQDDWALGKKTILEAGARADWVKTLYFLPRIALLYRPAPGLTARLGGGLAYKLPTVYNASDEEEAYQQVYPIDPRVRAERSASANLSLNYKFRIGDEMILEADQNFYYTRLTWALVPQPDSLRRGWLYYLNAPGPVVSRGMETNARMAVDELSIYVGYTYTDARRVYLSDHPQLPLTPIHRVVGNLSYEVEPSWKAGIDAFYTGRQVLGQCVHHPPVLDLRLNGAADLGTLFPAVESGKSDRYEAERVWSIVYGVGAKSRLWRNLCPGRGADRQRRGALHPLEGSGYAFCSLYQNLNKFQNCRVKQ
ncbi:TonB-dependent receptor plug domain-containing protein [Puia sp. P3]|uniref:TonB-dependent receptor plug domain-containing protein n=1 Tax=Puia sp. P3 TaxID=3423952 RepID=UPI003D676E05